MEYNITKWGELKYSSACSDVIWKSQISWGEMEYNITRWSDLEDFPNLNVCDDSWVMVSMDRQNKYCLDVVMCDGNIEWRTQFLVRNIGT